MQRTQPYFEDVSVGDELPSIEWLINEKRLHLQTSGSQDWYPVHFDAKFAQKAGHADVFMNTGWLQAALVRLISDWMGDDGFLRRLRFEMRRQHRPGDTVVAKGRVVSKDEAEGAVTLEVWLENAREGVATPGEATVVLPRRG
jgi:acyl dehydratase